MKTKHILMAGWLSILVLFCIGVMNYCAAKDIQKDLKERQATKVETEKEEPEQTEDVEPQVLHAEEVEVIKWLDAEEVELIGRTIWGEAEGVKSTAERAAVAWCILNRVDAYGQTIEEVVTAPGQFYGYRIDGECPQKHLELAADVLRRYYAEKAGEANVGRVLPKEYLYFTGDGQRNHFSAEWRGTSHWNWSLDDPYITEQ